MWARAPPLVSGFQARKCTQGCEWHRRGLQETKASVAQKMDVCERCEGCTWGQGGVLSCTSISWPKRVRFTITRSSIWRCSAEISLRKSSCEARSFLQQQRLSMWRT
eukprot:5690491-Prymnesium_polylepis.1